jgi:hypothetical protein
MWAGKPASKQQVKKEGDFVLKTTVFVIGLVALIGSVAQAQEVLITDFPLGIGGTVGSEFFQPYHAQLKAIADTLHAYSLARAVIVGSADGVPYDEHHDAKNPGLSLGRAHALRNVLVNEFHVDSTQLLIQSNDTEERGGQYRYVSVRIDRELMALQTQPAPVVQPPAEQPVTEIREITQYVAENIGLRLSAGVSTSPFGGIPIVAGAVTWKRVVFIEGIVGHTAWSTSYTFQNEDLDTWRRMIGGRLTVYPWDNTPVGIVGGWVRIERISQKYYEYVKLSEGLMLGLEATPWRRVSVMGVYNPSRHRTAGDQVSDAKNAQFLLSATLHLDLGGAR